jgi:hypothetical protein
MRDIIVLTYCHWRRPISRAVTSPRALRGAVYCRHLPPSLMGKYAELVAFRVGHHDPFEVVALADVDVPGTECK